MWFRPLTGLQRHRLTNALFVAGVVSAIGTVTGSNLLGCPAVSRDNRLDDGTPDDEAGVAGARGRISLAGTQSTAARREHATPPADGSNANA
ncbi:hypothetical protein LPJ61_000421 [Coemansia biformis]|uniref:Uncharacterized protein n=1 Tax=Coemansia biformis TaxID=1286918 RepID=A0A9W7YIV5_9FUNG|nr:hypothetical protein LPJ61_000421 [Coemansia biformis]